MGEVAEPRHRGDVDDAEMRRKRIAQQTARALEPRHPHEGGEREPGAFEKLLHVALGKAEPPPDGRGAEAGIGEAGRDLLDDRAQPRSLDPP
jgi:hypothetical protein